MDGSINFGLEVTQKVPYWLRLTATGEPGHGSRPLVTYASVEMIEALERFRRHEFEADEFAAHQADAGKLVEALVKLYKENANTLTPDPLYSAFHDSHPPAPVRIANLRMKQATTG